MSRLRSQQRSRLRSQHETPHNSPTSEDTPASLADERNDSPKIGSLAFLLEDDPDNAVSLDDCRITTRQDLHARMTPAGPETNVILDGRTLTALARTENWFLVLLNGGGHRISAHFVNMNGGCQL